MLDGLSHEYKDINPLNIIYENEVKLKDLHPNKNDIYKIDIGEMSRVFANQEKIDQTNVYSVCMAPECYLNDGKELSQKADVWAVGCIAHHLLFGELPFEGIVEQMLDVQGYELPVGARVDAEVQDFLIQCLKKNPEERMGFYELESHAVMKCLVDSQFMDMFK